MMKRDELIKKLENHLRSTSRQLVKFDSEEETLQFLSDSFRSEFSCDFVGIMIKDGDYFHSKVWSGALTEMVNAFPIPITECIPSLINRSMMFEGIRDTQCEFTKLFINAKVPTWFTVPLMDEVHSYGFCVIGYFQQVKLMEELGKVLDEFGKDVAVALSISKRRELQKSKIMGMEWINQNLSLESSIETTVGKLVERAGKETNAMVACIYLYDEKENCFIYQPPSYGEMSRAKKILIENHNEIIHYFPCLETPGGKELTIPLIVDLKTIGVLHVENKMAGDFTKDDLESLEFLSNHVAVMLENARLFQNEKDHKQRLHFLLNYQQTLVKETVEGNGFDGITDTLSNLFSTSVILLDRFYRPISYRLSQFEKEDLQKIVTLATYEIFQKKPREFWFSPGLEDESTKIAVWSIDGGGDLLGYLVVNVTDEEIDDYYRLSIDLARNIYSIQFIKQRLVLDAKEQVKDSFLNKLFVEKIESEESIIQYANLFNWDPFLSHRVAILSLSVADCKSNLNLLEFEAHKSLMWEQLRTKLSLHYPELFVTNKEGEYILIAPLDVEANKPRAFWSKLFKNIRKWVEADSKICKPYLAIGGKTGQLEDYYGCYIEAVQALTVVIHRFKDIGFALFDELGAYTVLHQLHDLKVSELFIKKHLSPLLRYSEGKSIDLLETLRTFLERNGNIKETAENLFIHRSTLLYRLERITDLLHVDLNDSEHRFNLMMAFKLYDMYGILEKH